eukprot:scaffold5573_cov212-Amphora_coffeaeformis.AAC.2
MSRNQLSLQERLDQYEVMERSLLERIQNLSQSLERQSLEAMRERAALIAENTRLKRELEELKNGPSSSSSPSRHPQTSLGRRSLGCMSTTPSSRGSHQNHRPAKKGKYESEEFSEEEEESDSNEEEEDQKPKQYYVYYHCPVKGCRQKIAINQKYKPPITEDGRVCDQTRWDSKRLSRHLWKTRQHFREEHEGIAQEEWPPAFVVIPPGRRSLKKIEGEVCKYHCPVPGCSQSFDFPMDANPPLTEDGHVSDQDHWPCSSFHKEQFRVRSHFRTKHKNIPQEQWPPGFAMVRGVA